MRSSLFLCFLLVHRAVFADPPRRDFDNAEEEHSDLWQSVLEPGSDKLSLELGPIKTLLDANTKESLDEAEARASTLLKRYPNQAAIHYWLGRIHAARGQGLATMNADKALESWQRCYDSHKTAYQLAPTLAVGEGVDSLDYHVALCAARVGEYETSEVHLKRLITLSSRTMHVDRIQLLLGDIYMALGRLEHALSAFEAALSARHPTDAECHFALAVTYDRNHRTALGREHLTQALTRDPRFQVLKAWSKTYVPFSEEHYYLGLVSLHRSERVHALFYFRQFLSQAKESPWLERARHHYNSVHPFQLGDQLEIKGTATLDKARTLAVLRRAPETLQNCLASAPDVLVKVRITKTLGKKIEPEDPVRPGVSAYIEESGNRPAAQAAKACIENAGKKVSLPSPVGHSGTWVTVEFPLIAP